MGNPVNQSQPTKLLFECICGNFDKTIGGVHICPQNLCVSYTERCCHYAADMCFTSRALIRG